MRPYLFVRSADTPGGVTGFFFVFRRDWLAGGPPPPRGGRGSGGDPKSGAEGARKKNLCGVFFFFWPDQSGSRWRAVELLTYAIRGRGQCCLSLKRACHDHMIVAAKSKCRNEVWMKGPIFAHLGNDKVCCAFAREPPKYGAPLAVHSGTGLGPQGEGLYNWAGKSSPKRHFFLKLL